MHNAAPYLAACLDSLLAQTRAIDEVILVDDGSTDDSPAILAAYASRHPSLRVLKGPQRGAAGARNAGIEAATGDWLGFVDADDLPQPRMYERLLARALEADADIALCNGTYHYEGRQPDHPVYTDAPFPGPCSGAEWLTHKLENRTLLHMVWMHLYRRAFIERHRIRFVEGLMHEDVTWTTRALMLAPRVVYDDAQLYLYRRQPRSFTTEALDRRLLRVIDGAKEDARLLAAMADEAATPRLAGALRWQLVDGGLSVFHKIRQLSTADLRAGEWEKVRREKYLGLLWRNAQGLAQKRRVAGRWIRSLRGR